MLLRRPGAAAEVNLTTVSDATTPLDASLTIESWAWDGRKLYHNTSALRLPPLSAAVAWRTTIGALTGGHARQDAAVRCTLTRPAVAGEPAAAAAASTSVLLPRSFVGVPLRTPTFSLPAASFRSCGERGVCFSLASDALAPFVFLSTPLAGYFSENGMLLPPDESHDLVFHAEDTGVRPSDLRLSLTVESAAGAATALPNLA